MKANYTTLEEIANSMIEHCEEIVVAMSGWYDETQYMFEKLIAAAAERIKRDHGIECPVCNEVDPDGLEACATCYNGVIADLERNRQRAEKLQAEVDRLSGMLYAEHRSASEGGR